MQLQFANAQFYNFRKKLEVEYLLHHYEFVGDDYI